MELSQQTIMCLQMKGLHCTCMDSCSIRMFLWISSWTQCCQREKIEILSNVYRALVKAVFIATHLSSLHDKTKKGELGNSRKEFLSGSKDYCVAIHKKCLH